MGLVDHRLSRSAADSWGRTSCFLVFWKCVDAEMRFVDLKNQRKLINQGSVQQIPQTSVIVPSFLLQKKYPQDSNNPWLLSNQTPGQNRFIRYTTPRKRVVHHIYAPHLLYPDVKSTRCHGTRNLRETTSNVRNIGEWLMKPILRSMSQSWSPRGIIFLCCIFNMDCWVNGEIINQV